MHEMFDICGNVAAPFDRDEVVAPAFVAERQCHAA